MRTQVVFNPLNDVMKFQEKVGNIFESVMQNANKEFKDFALWRPVTDVYEFSNHYTVELEIPGVKKEDIVLNFEDKMLNISGEKKSNKVEIEEVGNDLVANKKERYFGKFSRKIAFALAVKQDEITAKFEDGILFVTLPKADEVKPKNITIS